MNFVILNWLNKTYKKIKIFLIFNDVEKPGFEKDKTIYQVEKLYPYKLDLSRLADVLSDDICFEINNKN